MVQDANHTGASPAAAGDAARPLLIVPEGMPIYYTNSTQLRVSLFDLILSFGTAEDVDGQRMTRVLARVAMSPQHAKVLSTLLSNNVERYEKQFGPISIPENVLRTVQADSAF